MLAVAFVIALLVVGGMALVNALTSNKEAAPPGASGPPGTRASAPAHPSSTGQPALLIKNIGDMPTVVTITGGNDRQVLFRGRLNPGEGRQFDDTPLSVVATDAGLVQVFVYGTEQPKAAGQRGEWSVPKR
ncbi:hypothetical protein [Actinomadura macrotermitis]|uniref:DUF4115 domain-containing protein n=1 Tax=Actinomadura macrotermitis TaxID=2585200 RepID=A0A7K0BUX7_9ACTN|nr:hypothetical protein [Actinomadura macrotermitis]